MRPGRRSFRDFRLARFSWLVEIARLFLDCMYNSKGRKVSRRKSCCVWLSFGREQILLLTGKQWWNAANINHTPRTRSKSKDELIHLVLAMGLGVKIKILLFLLHTDCKHGRTYFLFFSALQRKPRHQTQLTENLLHDMYTGRERRQRIQALWSFLIFFSKQTNTKRGTFIFDNEKKFTRWFFSSADMLCSFQRAAVALKLLLLAEGGGRRRGGMTTHKKRGNSNGVFSHEDFP